MRRQRPRGGIFIAMLVAPDGGRHILRNRTDPAYCGEAEGQRVDLAWIPRQHLCQRCLQQYMKRVLGAGDRANPTP